MFKEGVLSGASGRMSGVPTVYIREISLSVEVSLCTRRCPIFKCIRASWAGRSKGTSREVKEGRKIFLKQEREYQPRSVRVKLCGGHTTLTIGRKRVASVFLTSPDEYNITHCYLTASLISCTTCCSLHCNTGHVPVFVPVKAIFFVSPFTPPTASGTSP